jgi:hypothetical protein
LGYYEGTGCRGALCLIGEKVNFDKTERKDIFVPISSGLHKCESMAESNKERKFFFFATASGVTGLQKFLLYQSCYIGRQR